MSLKTLPPIITKKNTALSYLILPYCGLDLAEHYNESTTVVQ